VNGAAILCGLALKEMRPTMKKRCYLTFLKFPFCRRSGPGCHRTVAASAASGKCGLEKCAKIHGSTKCNMAKRKDEDGCNL
jgi:hypothetical protein